MFSKSLIGSVVLIGLTALTSTTPLITDEIEILNPSIRQQEPGFSYIGKIGNKTFLKHNITTNWPSSRSICNSVGFEAASVSTASEFSFLIPKLDGIAYWTSGRLRGENFLSNQDAYVWDDGEEITHYIGLDTNQNLALCITIHPVGHSYGESCMSGQFKGLCQTTSTREEIVDKLGHQLVDDN